MYRNRVLEVDRNLGSSRRRSEMFRDEVVEACNFRIRVCNTTSGKCTTVSRELLSAA